MSSSAAIDYANLATPVACIADFCLIPIGTPTASVSNEVAAVQRLMKASGLSYTMHSAGTTVEHCPTKTPHTSPSPSPSP
ncbi:related to ECM15 protein, involved in cell wall biogenesis and architecture [Rhynchosporium agropyri]|uniref:Related to ECM15 protein, involved in cell wall biogenesis and architecture n=1 Tax=Rhynchosporium agropyri TaxID=914238 RepID=A0A1E1KGQ4_9HELO|nr:related to ECM15 protein, involved in cell wall biogenesis and architecture [Rhynchosporium agropyri]